MCVLSWLVSDLARFTTTDHTDDRGRKWTIHTATNWSAFMHAATGSTDYSGYRASRKSASDWHGGVDWDDTLTLARTGWADGLDAVADVRDALWDSLGDSVERPSPRYAVAGQHVDVGRWLTGHPECMVAAPMEVETGVGRVAKVTVNGAVSGGVRADTLVYRGAAIALVVDALEACGVRCEVEWQMGIDDSQLLRVPLKAADQPLDIDRLTFALAHPCMLRRLVFSWMECQPREWRDAHSVGGGYGAPATTPNRYVGDVHSGRMHLRRGDWHDTDWLLGWVCEQLEHCGITLAPLRGA